VRERDQLARGGFGVIGIEQHHYVVGLGGGEMFESVFLAVVSLNQRMGHGAKQRNAEAQPRQHGGGAAETGQVSPLKPAR